MSSEPVISVRNPATGELCGTARVTPAAEVGEAIRRARAAQGAWPALPFRERGRLLRRLAGAAARDESLLAALMAETGKPRFVAEAVELLYLVELTRFYASAAGEAALADDLRRPFCSDTTWPVSSTILAVSSGSSDRGTGRS
jgi:acyl-CoA reductase-like NAD-dependent aldehyde dehydrogenase